MSWGSGTWADNDNGYGDRWSWDANKGWATKDWSDSIYGPSHTWTTKGWHDNGSRRHGNVPASGVEANEEPWKVTGIPGEFNLDPDAVDDTSSMYANTEGQEEQEEQNDTRSRGSQSRGEEQPRAAAALQNEQPATGFRRLGPPHLSSCTGRVMRPH